MTPRRGESGRRARCAERAGGAAAVARIAWVLTLAAAAAGAAQAETSGVSTSGFVVNHSAPVKVSPAQVYAALGRIGQWWSPDHTYSGQSTNMTIELRAGGCFCERWGAGNEIEHARVLFVARDAVLRLEGGLGPLQDLAVSGVLTISLKKAADGEGTEMKWLYRVSGAPDPALEQWAGPVDQVLGEQVRRLVAHVESVR
jgi:hypothetical protein